MELPKVGLPGVGLPKVGLRESGVQGVVELVVDLPDWTASHSRWGAQARLALAEQPVLIPPSRAGHC